MTLSERLEEYWTDGQSAVVVTGDSAAIDQLLFDLDLPDESPVNVSGSKQALALWGNDLHAYLVWRKCQDSHPNGARQPEFTHMTGQ